MKMAFSDHQISRLFINVTLTLIARPSEYDNGTIRNDVLSIIFASKRNSNDHNNYFLINSLVFQSLEITISNDDDDDEEEGGDTQETNEEGPGILQTQAKQDQIMQYLLYQ
ncbi:hypothetical protein BDC45DRAFT_541530 [Circinella umbellata]|nr:hypothetical protein BDC45DRAFT_541530 [Circinella umbellata]